MAQNEGATIVYGIAAATTFLAAGAFNAHQRGIEAMRAAREAENEAQYEAAVDRIILNNAELGQLALQLAHELTAERAKNASLQRALEQRQALLERMRDRIT